MEHHTQASTGWVHLAPLTFSALLLAAYLALLTTRRRPLPRWPIQRSIAFCGGCLMLGVVFWPGVSQWAMADFRGHMTQHLVVGAAAPLLLVLGAPITLFLGSVRPSTGRFVIGPSAHATRVGAHPPIGGLSPCRWPHGCAVLHPLVPVGYRF